VKSCGYGTVRRIGAEDPRALISSSPAAESAVIRIVRGMASHLGLEHRLLRRAARKARRITGRLVHVTGNNPVRIIWQWTMPRICFRGRPRSFLRVVDNSTETVLRTEAAVHVPERIMRQSASRIAHECFRLNY